MINKPKLIEMIDHCLYYSGESYSVVFYEKYKEMVRESLLKEEEKTACLKLLDNLVAASSRHLEILKDLRDDIERDERKMF